MREYLDLLRRYPDFRNLWWARVVSNLGDWFNLLASAQLISSLTQSGTAVSALFLARALPVFLVTPFAGVLADRVSRRNILVFSDLTRAATVICFLLVRDPGDIWLFYLLTTLQFTLSALYNPAHSALLANVVAPDDLVAATALDGFTWSTMLALGALLGGIAAATLGTQAAFVLDSLSFLLSAFFISRIRTAGNQTPAQTESHGGFFDFVEGMRYLRWRPILLAVALVKAGAAFVWGAVDVLQIPLANTVFPVNGSGTLTLGIMYALVGLGTGLGPIVARRFTGDSAPALVRAISIGFVTLSLSTIVLGVTHLLGVAFISVSLRAVGSGIIWVFSSALLLGAVEDRFRGRVMAFEFLALTLMQSLGTIYGGIALDKLDWQVQQAIVAAGLVGLGFAVAWITVARKIRVHYQATSPVATELLS